MLSRFSSIWLCDPKDFSPPGSSVRRTSGKNSQARILEWVAMSFSRVSSQLKDQTQGLNPSLISPALAGRFFTRSAMGEGPRGPNISCKAAICFLVSWMIWNSFTLKSPTVFKSSNSSCIVQGFFNETNLLLDNYKGNNALSITSGKFGLMLLEFLLLDVGGRDCTIWKNDWK